MQPDWHVLDTVESLSNLPQISTSYYNIKDVMFASFWYRATPCAIVSAMPAQRELAFYYPNPMWQHGDWIKNLVLFFDGIALLVPNYMKERPEEIDAPIVAGLREHGLLEIIEPETAVDKAATEKLATAMTDVITSGALDQLAQQKTAFQELSRSRLGYYGDQGLYAMIFEELKARGLARDSEDGASIPMHPMVRSLVLVLLSQFLRPYGAKIGVELSPATDMPRMVHALSEILSLKHEPSTGSVIEFDLNTVTVDLGAIPIDEVLSFRKENLQSHRHYSLSVRKFAMELSRMPEEERSVAFDLRQAELNAIADDLRKKARKAWKKPSSFGLTLIGAAISATSSPFGALIRAASAIAGYEQTKSMNMGAYSYLFNARERFGDY